MGTKAVRFSEKEEKLIDEFLKKNSFLDFSTLARISIMSFIEKPEIKFIPVNTDKKEINKASKGVH